VRAVIVQSGGMITGEVGEDENHPLISLMDVLGSLLEDCETDHIPEFA
jgi:hypothetical protein